jgi:hypothetical protein|tara:strand:+ start:492 stop:722 length:231 start_codon:yes stop_codon:yes gene_type:complete
MKNLILILLLTFSLTITAKEKCTTTIVEKLGDYKVKVIKKNTCGETTVIKIQTYLKKDWQKLQKKRKQRIKKRRNK